MSYYRTIWFCLSAFALLLMSACARFSPAEQSTSQHPRYVWVCSYPDLEFRSAEGELLSPDPSNGELIYETLRGAGIDDWDEEGSVGITLSVKDQDYPNALAALANDERLHNRNIVLHLHMTYSIDRVEMDEQNLVLTELSKEAYQMHGWGESVP